MEPMLEQASQILDQALLSYAAGQIEAACEHITAAAAMLHEIQLAVLPQELPPVPAAEAPGFLGVVAFEMPPALPSATAVTAPAQPVSVESPPESSLAVAA